MKLEKVTDLSYAEKTLLGKYRLCSAQEQAEIRAQLKALLVQEKQPASQEDASNE